MPRNVKARLFTVNAPPFTPSRNISAAATVASSKSNALSRLTGTDTAARNSAVTNARRLPRRRPFAVSSSSVPASSVNVRLVSSTSVGTRCRRASRRSGGRDRSADARSTTPERGDGQRERVAGEGAVHGVPSDASTRRASPVAGGDGGPRAARRAPVRRRPPARLAPPPFGRVGSRALMIRALAAPVPPALPRSRGSPPCRPVLVPPPRRHRLGERSGRAAAHARPRGNPARLAARKPPAQLAREQFALGHALERERPARGGDRRLPQRRPPRSRRCPKRTSAWGGSSPPWGSTRSAASEYAAELAHAIPAIATPAAALALELAQLGDTTSAIAPARTAHAPRSRGRSVVAGAGLRLLDRRSGRAKASARCAARWRSIRSDADAWRDLGVAARRAEARPRGARRRTGARRSSRRGTRPCG